MRRATTFATLTLALAAAGCGGGDDGPSREEFARQASDICRDIERESRQLGEMEPDSLPEIASFAQRSERTVQRGVDRLQELERPSGEAGETATQFVEALSSEVDRQLVPALRELRSAAQERDVEGIRRAAEQLQEIETERSDRLARELGATACAE